MIITKNHICQYKELFSIFNYLNKQVFNKFYREVFKYY
jgi:hypothetical protein